MLLKKTFLSWWNSRKKKKLFGIRTKLSNFKVFHRKSVGYRNEKIQIIMNRRFYLGLSILELSKTVMYELCKSKIWWKSKTVLHGYRQMIFIDDIYDT